MDTLIEVGISGYASCVAELCTMPIDVIKTRMQVNRGSTLADTARHIGSQGGISAFFNGVDPALLRQMLYGGLRYGLYSPISHALHAGSGEHSMLVNIAAAILSGGTAALIATPLDLLKVRMQLNQGLPGGITKALVTLAKAEGLAGLWRGAGATCARAAFLTAGEKVRGGETRRLPHLPTKNCIPTFTGNCATGRSYRPPDHSPSSVPLTAGFRCQLGTGAPVCLPMAVCHQVSYDRIKRLLLRSGSFADGTALYFAR
jgi:solute carrier family 25 uncoupling protein 8/9